MIAVIADDFTGAAEIGGVGLRYGLKVVIETSVQAYSVADLLIIATDLRSLPPGEASRKIKEITRQVMQLNPGFMFKKLDSVLRGNIAVEIDAQLSVLGKKRAILVPGNPGLGRTIENGHYYINGIPLNRTFFASSTDFPRNSSSVIDIIERNKIGISSRSVTDDLPDAGIVVGDVSSQGDLSAWAGRIDDETLAAGGAGFFDVILGNFYPEREQPGKETRCLDGRSLFILGSRYPKDQKMIEKVNGRGLVRMNMPEAIYRNRDFDPALILAWAEEIAEKLNGGTSVVVTIEHESHDEPGLSRRIRANIGQVVRKVIDRAKIDNLLIEGGATTSEILRNLGIYRLYPYRELGLGIIQMKVEKYPDLCITTKPGSYSWPDNIEFVKRRAAT